MSRLKFVPGQARTCPHCKATILESASICPACRHHLRLEDGSLQRAWTSFSALRVQGILQHSENGNPWEYSVVLTIRDDEGEEIARQVMGVGALKPTERRIFTLDVEVLAPTASGAEVE